MIPGKRYLFFFAAGFLLIIAAGYSTYLSIAGEEDIWSAITRYRRDNFYEIPGKWMNDQGDFISLSSFRGKKTVVSLVYLDCSASCPLIIQHLKRLDKDTDHKSNSYRFVVILLEDLTENPAIMAEYKKRYSIDGERWSILTSDYSTLDRLTGSYRIFYQVKENLNFQFVHTNMIAFVDEEGNIKREIRNLSQFNSKKIAEWMNNEF